MPASDATLMHNAAPGEHQFDDGDPADPAEIADADRRTDDSDADSEVRRVAPVGDRRDGHDDRPVERQELEQQQAWLGVGAEPPGRQADHPRRLPHGGVADDDRCPTDPEGQPPPRAQLAGTLGLRNPRCSTVVGLQQRWWGRGQCRRSRLRRRRHRLGVGGRAGVHRVARYLATGPVRVRPATLAPMAAERA